MPSHEPGDYRCPFCRLQRGIVSEHNRQSDVVATTDLALALISPKWWPANPGAALVIPRKHHENLYDLPRAIGHAMWDLVQDVAVAMRTAYTCDGIPSGSTTSPQVARTSGTSTSMSSRGTTGIVCTSATSRPDGSAPTSEPATREFWPPSWTAGATSRSQLSPDDRDQLDNFGHPRVGTQRICPVRTALTRHRTKR